MSPIEKKMREWLTDPDPAKRFHAEQRIAHGFEPSPELPHPLTMVANLARSVVSHIAHGMPKVDASLRNKRLSICQTCPQVMYSHRPQEEWRCGTVGELKGCGCMLARKTEMADASCPANPPRWGPEE